MKFDCVVGACKMHWAYIVLTLLLTCVMGSVLDENYCNYVYNHGCRTSHNTSGIEYRGGKSHRSCSIDAVTSDIKFTILLAKDRPRSSGLYTALKFNRSLSILKINFTLPNVNCDYEVALLVNSSITNEQDCKNHVFHKSNSYDDEIHSIERTVCVLSHLDGAMQDNCEEDKFSMWYEHVFTGCYALRFTIDGYKYVVRGNKFLVTDYRRTEVAEPKFRCYYEDRMDHAPSKELVTFALSISVHADTAGMILTLTPISYLDETKENACVQYSGQPLYTWEISMDGASPALENCSLTTVQLDNDTFTKDAECNFALRVPQNTSYCFKISLHDERCHRQTIWNPPPEGIGGRPPCAWLQSCTRIHKNTSAIEYNGMLRGSKQIDSDNMLLLPIAITVILMILIVTGTVLFVCRLHLRNARIPVYVNTNLRNLKTTEMDSVETTDDETHKSSVNNEEDDAEAIILLYARGTTPFMSLMTDFREILKVHCGCHVRDWYAASEWDSVARVGPSTWVVDLLKQKHRALWIDTPRARNLLDPEWRKNYFGNSRHFRERDIDEEAISDFRDLALPVVLDLVKKTIGPEAALQYNKHFVVRLEGFDAAKKRDDPFEDLSPHTRYLIPYHLGELCSHLSSWPSNINSQLLKNEEEQLRERLVRTRNNLP